MCSSILTHIDTGRSFSHDPTMASLDRTAVVEWYERNRARSQTLFDLLAGDTYYTKPIALRHPIVFYEGHLPGFSFNTLVKKGLGRPSIDPRLESLFARGIDPHQDAPSETSSDESASALPQTALRSPHADWPARDVVQQFAAEADRQVIDALRRGDVEQRGHPLLDHAEAVFAILEHEAMHQETLLY